MPFSVELYFDAASEERLFSWWELLSTAGGRTKRAAGGRPHVSLAVYDRLDFAAASSLVGDLAESREKFRIMFASVGLFPGEKPILHLAPKVTPELLALQREFLERFKGHTATLWEHYKPDRWMPHCTLARVPTRTKLSELVAECLSFELPLICTVVEIGLVELRPVRQRFVAPLRAEECGVED